MTLAEKAMAAPRKRNPRRKHRRDATMQEELPDLSVLWALDRVSFGQCATAMGIKNNNNLYVHLAWGIREAVRCGKLVDPHAVRGWK